MKKTATFLLLTATVACIGTNVLAQKKKSIDKIINAKEVERIEATLSSDAMEGRETFTPGIEKAAAFIAETFKKAKLQPGGTNGGYLQSFEMYVPNIANATAKVDAESIAKENIICQTNAEKLKVTNADNYEVVSIVAKDNFMGTYRTLRSKTNNMVVLIDTAHRAMFNRIKSFSGPRFASTSHQLFVLTTVTKPTAFSFDLAITQKVQKLANVVAVIPGKSKADEFVIFSGHYDHIGYGKPNEKGDSLYNGANDDASGTTAVLMLAKYFKALGNNERTLVFAAFTAEEVGGYGATYFSKQYDPAKVMAMFNIEMIGTDSKWGMNSAYITGYEKTNMGEILGKNLDGTAFKFYPDPYPTQNLFYRSDNATLARLGVPAHTISTSKMDSEPHYHKASDEIGTLNMQNMSAIIKAIALSSRSIVAGTDTPSRVNTNDLR
ncbi:MAG TPA: M28 family peptidase [Phnomibacter sp.]|nr:M28 family peptidase [Phnomibacter sp.]